MALAAWAYEDHDRRADALRPRREAKMGSGSTRAPERERSRSAKDEKDELVAVLLELIPWTRSDMPLAIWARVRAVLAGAGGPI